MSRLAPLTTVVLAALLVVAPLGGSQVYAAQEGQLPPAPFQRLRTGDRVRIVTLDGQRVSGRIGDLSPRSLTLLLGDGTTTVVSAARTGRIVVNDSVANGASMGITIGAAAGLAVALLTNSAYGEGYVSGNGLLALVGLGAGIGAGVGILGDGLRAHTVYDVIPGVRSALSLDVPVTGTPRLTVRPEIALHSNGRRTGVRAGGAMAVRW